MLTDGLECCDVFIRLSFWRHPFTAEHPLTLILTAPIHCRASIAETHFSKPDEETNSSDLGWSESEHVFVLTWFRNRSEDEHKPSGSCRPSRCEGCRTERVPVLLSVHPQHLQIWHTNTHLCMKNPDLGLQCILYLSKSYNYLRIVFSLWTFLCNLRITLYNTTSSLTLD